MKFKKCFFLTFVFLYFLSFPSFGQIPLILQRAQEELESDDPMDVSDALGLASDLTNHGGAFDTNGDMDYDMATDYLDLDEADCEDDDEGDWYPIEHLKNLADMAVGYSAATDPDVKEDIAEGIIDGLEYWYDDVGGQILPPCFSENDDCRSIYPDPDEPTDPTTVPSLPWCCDNWFPNQIETYRELEIIAILFKAELDVRTDLRTHIIDNLPDNNMNVNNGNVFTGANLADVAAARIVKGILLDSLDIVEEGVGWLEEGLLTTGSEGIQPDFSFHQHGPMLYTGGYGQSLIENVSRWGYILATTDQQYSSEARRNCYDFILKGYRWTLRGYTSDYSANGREIARTYPGSNGPLSSKYIRWVRDMADDIEDPTVDLNGDSDDSLYGDLDDIVMNDDLGQTQNVNGNNYYWKSDYVVHHEANYMSSVKMCSSRTLGIEEETGDNLKGYWLPYGCTFIYQDGDEYIREDGDDVINIFPYYDWSKIPGVTSADLGADVDGKTFVPELKDIPEADQTQSASFVGTVSNGDFGVTGMVLNKNYDDDLSTSVNMVNISAKKAWFHFGAEIIAFGADIKSPDHPAHTTINQSLKVGTVEIDGSASAMKSIVHDQIAYVFPGEPAVMVSEGSQPGDWTDINEGEDETENYADVFKAWINHGTPTTNDPADYYYIIAPGQNAATYANDNPVKLLKNTAEIQAIRKAEPDGDFVSCAVFYPGFEGLPDGQKRVAITPNIDITVDHPCAVLFDSNTGQICISSPDRANDTIVLTIFPVVNR